MTPRQEIEKAITETVSGLDDAVCNGLYLTEQERRQFEAIVRSLVDAVLEQAASLANTCESGCDACAADAGFAEAIRALKSQPTEAQKP